MVTRIIFQLVVLILLSFFHRLSTAFVSPTRGLLIRSHLLDSRIKISGPVFLTTDKKKYESVPGEEEEELPSEQGSSPTPAGPLSKIKNLFSGGTFNRQTMANLGTNFLLAYGFTSNIFSTILTASSWFISSKQSGLSPLAPGQWKEFVKIYTGLYLLLNIIRPLRFAITIAVSKYFETAIIYVQEKLNVRKAKAVGLIVFLFNFCGTLVMMAGGIALASLLSGVPIWA
mmetsp:Transcript_22924/g.32808  ORF Transcript_22924/g.32808 Transcript_22924/m.32808 type:complete len:229 (+) Transcript_22924:19-705(+)